ncbi:hypothetical protein NKH77_11930 [Streptomyces sp. M19]
MDDYYAVTGGNPLLLRALQEDRLLTHVPDTPPNCWNPPRETPSPRPS